MGMNPTIGFCFVFYVYLDIILLVGFAVLNATLLEMWII